MKNYITNWVDEYANIHLIDTGETKDLKHACFNAVCKMAFQYPNIFKLKHDRIIENIKRGKLERESYFAIVGDQVIITFEDKKRNSNK